MIILKSAEISKCILNYSSILILRAVKQQLSKRYSLNINYKVFILYPQTPANYLPQPTISHTRERERDIKENLQAFSLCRQCTITFSIFPLRIL